MQKPGIILLLLLFFLRTIIYAGVSKRDLKYVMPSAISFSKKIEDLPHYKAYKKNKLIGICYVSIDVTPEIIGYSGPIKILIGLYSTGKISGIKILKHVEANKPAETITDKTFHRQFAGKNTKDSFIVGKDVDNITGATVTVESVCEIVKDSSLIMYLYYFKKGGTGIQKKLLNLKNKRLRRIAKIDRIEELALEKNNKKLLTKVEKLRTLERKQYLMKLKKIAGIHVDKKKEEKIILKPKWGIKKVNKKLIKEQIKSGNLSEKEADYYTK